jgi:hypothetical protein
MALNKGALNANRQVCDAQNLGHNRAHGWRPIRFSPLQFGSRDELNGLIDK